MKLLQQVSFLVTVTGGHSYELFFIYEPLNNILNVCSIQKAAMTELNLWPTFIFALNSSSLD